jgi:hypothetical protein
MKVTEITVVAARTFNHPREQYSNLRPSVAIKASLAEGENFEIAINQLQAKAEKSVEDHKMLMLNQIEDLYRLGVRQRQIADLEQTILKAQADLDSLRQNSGNLLEGPELFDLPRAEE